MNTKNNLKVKIKYKDSDDVFVCDLIELKVLERYEDGTAKEIKIDYFDPFSAEGHKTLYLRDHDYHTVSVEISSLKNRIFENNSKYKQWY